ncbi:MAG: hypothetical protein JHC38_06700 [Thiotrichales bacterium]|jgi:hypothetical protein|nr:hypothetical protein [Thiotrichales bacterium]
MSEQLEQLKHIKLNMVCVSKPWMNKIKHYLETMYQQHPDWLEHELTFGVRVKFGRLNYVDVRTKHQPLEDYLVTSFGNGQGFLYSGDPLPSMADELNHTCEFCGEKGETKVFGGGSVGWWVIQCDKEHLESEFTQIYDPTVNAKGEVTFSYKYPME